MSASLKDLFDFQKFAKNPGIDEEVAGTAGRYVVGQMGVALSDDDLMLNAAGEESIEQSDENLK